MSLKEYYKKHDKEIWSVGFMTIILVIMMAVCYDIGYDRGQDDYVIPRPEYEISSYSMRMNATFYNYTYYALTRDDMISSRWTLDVEQRDDYFMLSISIHAMSDNWTDFYVFVNPLQSYWNVTIELISIMTIHSHIEGINTQNTDIRNFYDGSYGGTWCHSIARINFLGYGDTDIEGIDIALSSLVSITGIFK